MTTTPDINLDEFDDSFDAAANPDGAGGDDDFAIDLPPTICGVLRMHIAEVKQSPKNKKWVIVTFKCEEALFREATYDNFFDFSRSFNVVQFEAMCNALGVETTRVRGQLRIIGGLKALKGRAGLFVITTFKRKDGTVSSTIANGMPKAGKSEEWDEYIGTRSLTEAQTKAITKCQGVIPEEHHHLFEGFNAVD